MNILVVAPHSDDETLGAGGTLLKLKKQGHNISLLNVTMADEKYGYTKEFVDKRKEQMRLVADAYQFDKIYNLELEPAGLDKISKQELITKFGQVFIDVSPELVFLPYEKDVHSDHGIVFESAYSCTKAFRYPFVKVVLAMEILSETDYANPENGFVPNLYVNIEKQLQQKINIMKIYESEIKNPPFPRSEENIRSLATFRGCSAGYKYAEGFKIIKAIWG
ncbi:PIG-L family deacetylase [Roseburia hominis]|uniref:PIG-L deacetylase family protein n=1 Tax=Roseburia hominis TaxID=301301 RepID=UPI001F3A2075|nr:PIG-L family deacetylase [Roseburia hominis]